MRYVSSFGLKLKLKLRKKNRMKNMLKFQTKMGIRMDKLIYLAKLSKKKIFEWLGRKCNETR
jgi:hypothetical protein